MRSRMLSLLVVALGMGPQPVTAEPTAGDEVRRLEQAWHRCLRGASAHQPAGQSRAGNQRNALDECQEHENAYVSATLSARADDGAADPSLPARARSWAAAVAATLLDPVGHWLGSLRR